MPVFSLISSREVAVDLRVLLQRFDEPLPLIRAKIVPGEYALARYATPRLPPQPLDEVPYALHKLAGGIGHDHEETKLTEGDAVLCEGRTSVGEEEEDP
jgi:hypothetical protein